MRQLKNSLLLLLFLLALYALLRLGFFLANLSFFTDIPASDIALAFLYGIRFDIAGILWLNLPLVILYNLPYKPLQWKWYRVMLALLFLALNIVGLLVIVADIGYYPTVQRRLTYELYATPLEILGALPGMVVHHYVLFAVFLAGCVVFGWSALRLLRWIGAGVKGPTKHALEIPLFLVVVALTVVGIRGGLQLKPIRPTNAFFSTHQATGYLALNTTYTVIRSWFQESLPRYRFLDDGTAIALIREMLHIPSGERGDPEYPFLQEHRSTAPEQRRNVIIIIMESWSAKSIGALGARKSVTPFFDSLSASGTLFTNFMASGQRSMEAMPAVLASIPSLANQALIGSKEEMHTFRGLGSILAEKGYATSFHHGAALGSMGFDAFARVAGFDRYYSQDDTRGLTTDMLDGVWGVYDEPFFLETAQRISELPQPFCSTIFSLSSHDPFRLPSALASWAESFRDNTEFEMSLRYSDYALRRFFSAARTQPWFHNTVFVLTGDHTFHSIRNNLRSTFHVPLWVFDPNDPTPRRVTGIGSHVDILPTLLDVLHVHTHHASMGTSLVDTGRARYAVVKFGPQFVIFDDSLALMHDLEKVVGLYDYRTDPFSKRDLQLVRPGDVTRLRERLFAYLQTTTTSLAHDRVYPKRR